MILRVACDTNVLVSAFIAAGPPSRILEETINGRIELVLPRPVIVELERILTGKLGFEEDRWQATEQLLVNLAAELVDAPAGRPEAISGDPDDDLILACVVEAEVEVLVSGDRRHLLPLGEHRGVRIVTPQALLAELRGG
ncbi:MAG: putative toxin-antitoxin system toxin component, PIN family [Actinobacteria bacterium]|nr:putative toxin-antitoxin system toxin component, PIN family [Actinomycetota bacterium]